MKKVLIYVEGQTEETFIRDILGPHLNPIGIHPIPILARTKRTRSGATFKGGVVSYDRIRREVLRLLGDSTAVLVTTMMDYYGLPSDFPGKAALSGSDPYQRVAQLERAFQMDISNPRFLPFLTLHEFESLLFAHIDSFISVFPHWRKQVEQLSRDIAGRSPEEINDGRDTHPAARICRYIPDYRKTLHGPLIAQRIGLPTIRAKCPHFDQWVSRLESL